MIRNIKTFIGAGTHAAAAAAAAVAVVKIVLLYVKQLPFFL
jgi:hypothetical protein